jgi:hypothetical protein
VAFHAKSLPLEGSSKTGQGASITTPKKDDLVAAVFTVDRDYPFRVADEVQTLWLIEARARNVQATIVALLGALEGIERKILPRDRLRDLRSSRLDSTPMGCDDYRRSIPLA